MKNEWTEYYCTDTPILQAIVVSDEPVSYSSSLGKSPMILKSFRSTQVRTVADSPINQPFCVLYSIRTIASGYHFLFL